MAKEFKNEFKQLKDSHQAEKEELKLQISTENLTRRSAEDAVYKLKSESLSISSNLNTEISKMELVLKIKEQLLIDLQEKVEFLLNENGKLKTSSEDLKINAARIKSDLEKSEIEKNQYFSDYKDLQSKYSNVVANLEISNSTLESVALKVEQASHMYFLPFNFRILVGLEGDGTDKNDFSSVECVQNSCIEKYLERLT